MVQNACCCAGTVLETLKQEGIAPESIKNIFITHVHVDHHGGIVNNWEEFLPVYPEATIHVSTPELENILLEEVQFGDSGLDTEARALMSTVGKGVFAAVRRPSSTVQTWANNCRVFKGGLADKHTAHHLPMSLLGAHSRLYYIVWSPAQGFTTSLSVHQKQTECRASLFPRTL